ncbi:MAG: hypothetical protein ACKO96_48270 [Flammeovirgaceae bacterium]
MSILNEVDNMQFGNVEIKYQICNNQDYQKIPVGQYIECPYFDNQEDQERFWNEFKIVCYSDGQVMLEKIED